MHRTLPLAIMLALSFQLPSSVGAQTTGDDLPAIENWWDKVGAKFFSDEGLTMLRPEAEIRAHWTALSADDQAAVRARCAELGGQGTGEAASQQQGSNTGLDAINDTNEAADDANQTATDEAPARLKAEITGENAEEADPADQTSVTGAADGTEIQEPAEGTIGYTGLAGGNPDDLAFAPVCTLVVGL